jgi:hypothetical protein
MCTYNKQLEQLGKEGSLLCLLLFSACKFELMMMLSELNLDLLVTFVAQRCFELPSLEQIEQMERQRSQAIQALEI